MNEKKSKAFICMKMTPMKTPFIGALVRETKTDVR